MRLLCSSLLASLLFLTACATEVDEPSPELSVHPGKADGYDDGGEPPPTSDVLFRFCTWSPGECALSCPTRRVRVAEREPCPEIADPAHATWDCACLTSD